MLDAVEKLKLVADSESAAATMPSVDVIRHRAKRRRRRSAIAAGGVFSLALLAVGAVIGASLESNQQPSGATRLQLTATAGSAPVPPRSARFSRTP